VRESSGLALSSRNAYLNEAERQAAAILYRALSQAKAAYANGERSAKRLAELISAEVAAEPRARLEYVGITDADTLERLDKLDERPALVALAARLGNTRLIDNIVLQPAKTNMHNRAEA